MEKKQLDFNAPLLSVRRYSSKAASSEGEKTKRTEDSQRGIPYLPRYISDLKSGPIRNAGEVPFTWEKIPGRPKDEGESKAPSLKWPSIAPKLPPGRNLEVKERSSANSEGKTTIRFQNANVPKHPNNFSSRTNVTTLEISKDGMKKKDDSDSDSEDGDDAYADALDTLSRTESFFYNCSVSGVSGLDGPDAKPSGVFSSDPQTRDFMMGRFLPAAKAMASETPQYAPRRQPVTQEPSSEVKMVLNGDRRPTVYRYRPDIIPYVHDTVEEESDDEDDEFSDTGNLSTKACGLLPRFCLKSSLCLLSPVPGMKVRSRASLPSVRKVIEVKVAQSGSHSSSNDEGNWEAVYKHKLMTGVKPLEEESKLNTDSNRLTCSSDSQTPDGSSSHMGSGGGGISPYRNDTAQSPFHEGRGFLGIPKPVKSSKADCFDPYNNNRIICQGTLSHFNWKHGSYSSSPNPMVEKTLHVDSIHAVQSATSELVSSDTKGLKGRAETDAEVLTASKGTEDTSVTGSCPGDKNSLIVSTEGSLLQPKLLEAAPFDSRSSSNRSILSRHSMEGFRKVDGRDHESRALECPELTTCVDLVSYKQHVLTTDDKKNYSLSSLHSPLSPPLPKSPSESWLWRTLPSVSSRNGAQFHTKKQSIKMSSADPKWETMVKTSNMHHSRLRFSEDLSTPLSQISES